MKLLYEIINEEAGWVWQIWDEGNGHVVEVNWNE